ncbi:MAG: lytic transglycosylase domain-containing protein [Candidatus Hydrogenedentota bacterium]|nr:MAG: lytic transglycosylase domain-containing protein [Candidatus Hydrogenedentota bacterium]
MGTSKSRWLGGAGILLLSVSLLSPLHAESNRSRIVVYQDAEGNLKLFNIPLPEKGKDIDEDGAFEEGTEPIAETAYDIGSYGPQSRYRRYVAEAARRYNLSEALIWAVMKVESNFNPYAVSRHGAQGLMQLIPSTARIVGVRNLFDPRENILGGARYLRMMFDRFGRMDYALAAYNAGPASVEKYGGIPPFPETRRYVPKVLRYYKAYSGGKIPDDEVSSLFGKRRPRRKPRKARFVYYRGADGQIYVTAK